MIALVNPLCKRENSIKLFLINTNAIEKLVHNLLSTFKNHTLNSQYKTLIILWRMQ